MTAVDEGKEELREKNGPLEVEEETGVGRGGRGMVRRATFADLDAIIDINDNIYDGMDYFQAYFYIFMQSKQYATYVYELDGKLVALCCFYFVPDVDDLVSITALRVRPSFQGQGFGRPDQNPITDQFRKEYPSITHYTIQTLFKPNIKAKIHQRKLLYHWNVLVYRPSTNRQRLERASTLHQHANPQCTPTTLSYTEGTDWLRRSDKLINFLSGYAVDYIVAGVNWIPVRINSTELRKLFTDHIVFVSFARRKGGEESTFIQSTDESLLLEEDEIVGFSSSILFQCKYGVNFHIQFHGDSEADLLSHVYSHMLHYVSVTQDDVRIACSLQFPLSIDSDSVRENLREELGETYESEYFAVKGAVEYMAAFDRPTTL